MKLQKPFVIAEAGVNHEGSLDVAIKMVEEASRSGCDAIKFQTYKADSIAAKESPAYWDTSFESTKTQHQLFSKYDSFGVEEFIILYKACEHNNIEFMTTFFDIDSLSSMDNLVKRHKISSSDLTNYPLIRKIASLNKPIIMSVGAADFNEIDSSVDEIVSISGLNPTLLHCVLKYPTPNNFASLSQINTLIHKYPKCSVGYSDHTLPDVSILIYACLLGASVIEKHFTLTPDKHGNDHYHAFTPAQFNNFNVEYSKLSELYFTSPEFIKDQEAARLHARRSLYAKRDIPANTCLTNDDVISLRPTSELGFQSNQIDLLIGSVVCTDISKGSLIKKEFISKNDY